MGLLDNGGREQGQWPPFPLKHFQEKWNSPVRKACPRERGAAILSGGLYSGRLAQRNAATAQSLIAA
jgi:hypothetical protein